MSKFCDKEKWFRPNQTTTGLGLKRRFLLGKNAQDDSCKVKINTLSSTTCTNNNIDEGKKLKFINDYRPE